MAGRPAAPPGRAADPAVAGTRVPPTATGRTGAGESGPGLMSRADGSSPGAWPSRTSGRRALRPAMTLRALGRLSEALPFVAELAAELADAARRQPVAGTDVRRRRPAHQVVDQAAVALPARPQPGGEVQPEGHLLRDRRLAVIAQGLAQGAAEAGLWR